MKDASIWCKEKVEHDISWISMINNTQNLSNSSTSSWYAGWCGVKNRYQSDFKRQTVTWLISSFQYKKNICFDQQTQAYKR